MKFLPIFLSMKMRKKGGGGLSSLMGDIAGGGFSLDGMIGGGSVNDEILVISSHSLIREMVQRLDLNISYTSKKTFSKRKSIIVILPYRRNSRIDGGYIVEWICS